MESEDGVPLSKTELKGCFTLAINVKKLLAQSLLELFEEGKPLDKITVTDIIKRAGAGRQTFYNHFKDKNDLMYWIYKQSLKGETQIIQEQSFSAYLCSVYKTAQQRYPHFLQEACKITGQNCLADAIVYQSYIYYRNRIRETYGDKVFDDQLKFALHYQAYGAGYRYVNWALAGMPGDAEEEVRNVIHCMPKCMKQYLPLTEEELNY